MPDWARGKTADEILSLGEKFRNAALVVPQPLPQKPAPSQPMTQPQQEMNVPQLPDPNLAYSDLAAYNRQMKEYVEFQTRAQLQQFAAPILAQQSDFAKMAARQNPRYTPIFDKYGAEVDAQMANVPFQARTREAWEMAAKLVLADHVDEFARAEAEKLAVPSDTGTVSASGGMPASRTLAGDPITQLFLDNDPAVARLKAIGKTAEDAKRTALQMGLTVESYADMLKKQSVVVHSTSGAPTNLLEQQHATAAGATA